MRQIPKISLSGALLAFLLAAPLAYTQDDGDVAPLFGSHEPLEVTIEAPLTTLMDERPDEEYLDGTFSYVGDDGAEHSLDLKIRTRGNFRRQKKTCDFAPIRLNFKKKQVKDTEFDGQDKLKLVVHCKFDQPYYEQLVLKEYLAYRFLQVLTDKSFSVRLLHINYVNTEDDSTTTRYAFVIEDNDDVADRLGMESIKSADISHDDLDPAQESLVNLFQYMIGNTDYSLVKGEDPEDCCHNSELLTATGEAPYTPLPYDFDLAGLVNARYAVPNPQFKLRSVRQRRYRGVCEQNELLPGTIQHFLDHRDAIYAIIDDLAPLDSSNRKDITGYLDSFFEVITSPRAINGRLINRCA
jgi:hypothetical protein